MQSSTRGLHSRGRPTQPVRPPTTTARLSTCKAILRTRYRRLLWTKPTSMTRTFGATRSLLPEKVVLDIVNGGFVMESVNGGSVAVRHPVGVAEGVWKAFGETQALRGVSLDVEAGECHGVVGRNGAGKSTMVGIFTGLIRPDRGVVRLGAEAAPSLADCATWQRLVACVYQKSMVVPSLTVAENVFLNRATGDDHGIVNWRAIRSRARQVMLEWGFDLDVNRLVQDLSVEQRQV